ncbi:hypothetical protein GCM10022402_32410 [Salinactinospora qingdaonensis]|uniref:Uncharacterized protein n=1 Tax=Salinactinospora qingdaonensis TaxID=702744 RepID=A0ABP7FXB5_9ACTN
MGVPGSDARQQQRRYRCEQGNAREVLQPREYQNPRHQTPGQGRQQRRDRTRYQAPQGVAEVTIVAQKATVGTCGT